MRGLSCSTHVPCVVPCSVFLPACNCRLFVSVPLLVRLCHYLSWTAEPCRDIFSPCLSGLYPKGHEALNLIYLPLRALHPLPFIFLFLLLLFRSIQTFCVLFCVAFYRTAIFIYDFHVHFSPSLMFNEDTSIRLKMFPLKWRKWTGTGLYCKQWSRKTFWKMTRPSDNFLYKIRSSYSNWLLFFKLSYRFPIILYNACSRIYI